MNDPIAGVVEWALQHLAEPLPIDQIAAAFDTSPSEYRRRFDARNTAGAAVAS